MKMINVKDNRGFTLMELLIVLGILAILMTTVIRNFVGFDAEARITATKTSLDNLRTQITLFRAKEGRYPESMQELLDTYYFDVGVKKPYLSKMPPEMISVRSGNNAFVDLASSQDSANGEGGWVYYIDTADLRINITEPLDKKWGEYEGQKPLEW